ncbi:MAG: hypothetical protein ABID54_02130, partial [Pseudomonadota bacterium]
MSRIVIMLALVLFYSGGVCYAEDQPLERGLVGKRTELTHLKKELQRKKQKVKAIGKKEHSVGSELIRIERRLSKRTRELKLLRSKIRKLNNKMKVVDNQVSKIDEDIRALRSRLDVCLTAMYKFGGIGHIQAVFSSRSYIDMSRPYRFINIILNDDLELIEQYKEELLMIGEKKEQLERAERKLVTLKADR